MMSFRHHWDDADDSPHWVDVFAVMIEPPEPGWAECPPSGAVWEISTTRHGNEVELSDEIYNDILDEVAKRYEAEEYDTAIDHYHFHPED